MQKKSTSQITQVCLGRSLLTFILILCVILVLVPESAGSVQMPHARFPRSFLDSAVFQLHVVNLEQAFVDVAVKRAHRRWALEAFPGPSWNQYVRKLSQSLNKYFCWEGGGQEDLVCRVCEVGPQEALQHKQRACV